MRNLVKTRLRRNKKGTYVHYLHWIEEDGREEYQSLGHSDIKYPRLSPGSCVQPDWMATWPPYYQDVDKIRCCPMATRPSVDYESTEMRGDIDHARGRPDEPSDSSHRDSITKESYWGSYGLNRWVTDPLDNDGRYWKYASAKNADEAPVILDCVHWHLRPKHDNKLPTKPLLLFSDFPENGRGGTQIWRAFLDRHNKAIHSCSLDGSVGKIPLPTLWDVKWHRRFEKQGYTRATFPFLQ